MFDIHCHILPGLDDGAYSEDESLTMLGIAAENGTYAICCTPHSGGYSFETLLQTFRRFKRSALEHGIPIKLYLGQEIFIPENYREQLRGIGNGYPVTMNRSAYPLIEFSPLVHASAAFNAVEELISMGLIPVIAHPERYAFVAQDAGQALRLKKAGALLQLNSGSLKGMFGSDAQRAAEYLLYHRAADFVSSDAHSPYSRPPRLRGVHAYISEQYSMEYADHILRENPRRLIRNEKIHPY